MITLYEPIFQQQSPIAIHTASTYRAVGLERTLTIDYPNEDLPGRHEGDDFYFDTPPPMRLDGKLATLRRIHYHAGSEHTIDGTKFDFEVHLVNQLSRPEDASTAVVLAVFFSLVTGTPTCEEEPHPSPPLRAADLFKGLRSWRARQTALGTEKSGGCDKHQERGQVNPRAFLPCDLSRFFRYEGSLTTKPFDQVVRWVVFRDHTDVSKADADDLPEPECAREVQPLDRRYVLRAFDLP